MIRTLVFSPASVENTASFISVRLNRDERMDYKTIGSFRFLHNRHSRGNLKCAINQLIDGMAQINLGTTFVTNNCTLTHKLRSLVIAAKYKTLWEANYKILFLNIFFQQHDGRDHGSYVCGEVPRRQLKLELWPSFLHFSCSPCA